MFTLHFTNVICSSEGLSFDDVETAFAAGRKAGFEFSIRHRGEIVASWTVFGGRRDPGPSLCRW